MTTTCAGGRQLTGAAAQTFVGAGQVGIAEILPGPGLTSVFVSGLEDANGTTSNWGLIAYGICATPHPGLERVTATSALDSSNKSVTAGCPADKRVLGAGATVGGGGQVLLDDISPNPALSSVTVKALEDEDGTAEDWLVTALAICATPPPGLERVTATSALDSSGKSVAASCPANKNLVGVGGNVNAGNGQVVIDALSPFSGLKGVRVTGFEDETGNAGPWSLTAYAICASP